MRIIPCRGKGSGSCQRAVVSFQRGLTSLTGPTCPTRTVLRCEVDAGELSLAPTTAFESTCRIKAARADLHRPALAGKVIDILPSMGELLITSCNYLFLINLILNVSIRCINIQGFQFCIARFPPGLMSGKDVIIDNIWRHLQYCLYWDKSETHMCHCKDS